MSPLPRPKWLSDFPKLAEVYDQWIDRDVVPKEVFDALSQELKTESFSVAGEMTNVSRQRLLDLLGKAISDGMTIEQWQAATASLIESPSYASLVFRTNVSNAFDGAHYAESFGPYGEDYPAWQFIAWIDSANVTEEGCPGKICRYLDGRVFMKTDEAAMRLLPKVHWGCRCRTRDVPASEVETARISRGSAVLASHQPQDDWDFDKRDLIPEALQ